MPKGNIPPNRQEDQEDINSWSDEQSKKAKPQRRTRSQSHIETNTPIDPISTVQNTFSAHQYLVKAGFIDPDEVEISVSNLALILRQVPNWAKIPRSGTDAIRAVSFLLQAVELDVLAQHISKRIHQELTNNTEGEKRHTTPQPRPNEQPGDQPLIEDEDKNEEILSIRTSIEELSQKIDEQSKILQEMTTYQGGVETNVMEIAVKLDQINSSHVLKEKPIANETNIDSLKTAIDELKNHLKDATPNPMKPTYAAIARPSASIPTKHMEVIARNENKSKQVLVKVQPNHIKTIDERTLVAKANQALNACVDPPNNTEFISAKRVREDTIRYELNTTTGALWLKIAENAKSFTTRFNADSNIVNESEKLIAEFVPVTLNPTDTSTIREIERKSGLQDHSIASIEWIKRIDRRKPEQKVAFATIRIISSIDANEAIRNGLIIEGKRVSLTKAQPDPSRCFNCQLYPKPFHLAKDCPNKCRCGTCGEENPDHNTHDCLITDPDEQACVSCNTKGHPSWSRNCPTFLEEKKKLQQRRKSTNYRFFPTAEDPSTWEEINTMDPPMAPPLPLPSNCTNKQLITDYPTDSALEDEANTYHQTLERHDARKAAPAPSTNRNPTNRRSRGGRHNAPDRSSTRGPPNATPQNFQTNLNGYVQISQRDREREASGKTKQTISPPSSLPQLDQHANQPPLPPSSPFSPSRPIRESLHLTQ